MSAPETPAANLDMGVIGNAAFAALIDDHGRIVWSCMPHFDGDPVFCHLLDSPVVGREEEEEDGLWAISLEKQDCVEQFYERNTAILETHIYDKHGGHLKVTDFAPRYEHYERFYKPSTICRIVEPMAGEPRITVKIKPRFHYGETKPIITRGGNHMRFQSTDMALRLTTDAPITYIQNEVAFVADRKLTFILGPDEPLRWGIEQGGERLLALTRNYWLNFTRRLAIPFEWQSEVIRAAITLKLCTFEETGAILAALTTSIPESPNSQRHWDYRFCWLRDSLFVVNALNSLGLTESMQAFENFMLNISWRSSNGYLRPFYGISLSERNKEVEVSHLRGYRGMGPVRIGNEAYIQKQNDVWGCVILALTQYYFDERLQKPGTVDDFKRLESFGEDAYANFEEADSGIWEFRNFFRQHTFSAVMCWVACDRLQKIANRLGLEERQAHWQHKADHIHHVVMAHGYNEEINSFVEPFDSTEVDASLLLLHEVGFIDAKDPKFTGTIRRIEENLMEEGLLYRYKIEDDFGKPEVAFTICTFWYIDALAANGEIEKARAKFDWMLSMRNHLGMLSEDIDFKTHELWGNFPQTYSMVGIIKTAMRLSKTWHEAI